MRHASRPKSQPAGSTFILVLVALVIITFLGLSLTFVTEIEMQLGGNERIMTQTFYGAESGIHAPIAAVITSQDWRGEEFAFIEGEIGDRWIGRRVRTSRVHAIGPPQAPPMTMANEGEAEFGTYSIFLRATAERVAWPKGASTDPEPPLYPDGDPRESQVTVQSQTQLTIRYVLSPLQKPPTGDEPYNDASPIVF